MAEQRQPRRARPEADAETLRRAQAGDRAALGRLVRIYEPAVRALIGRLLFAVPDQVEDLAQESFVKVLTALPRFDPRGPAKLSTWVLTIATRTALDELRRPRRAAAAPVAESQDPSAHAWAEARQLTARVEAAMAELPAEHRAVLVLRAYHDLDYQEIAAATGLEVGTVKSRLSRARAALRRSVQPQETS